MRLKTAISLLPLVTLLVLCGCNRQLGASSAELMTQTLHADMLYEDGTLHVRVMSYGASEDTLIGIHGGPGNSSAYMVSLQQLATSERAVVLYDQRGVGQSSRPVDGYAVDDYVSDLEAVRRAVGAETIHLLGHSWGGIVALSYANAYPQHVASIILMGSGVYTNNAVSEGHARRAVRIEALMELGVIPELLTSPVEILPAYFSDPEFDVPEELRHLHYNAEVERKTQATLSDTDLAAGLETLTHPVLVVYGEDDPYGAPLAASTEQTLTSADVTIETLESCGHYWHEQPDAFLSIVDVFLKSL